MNVYKHPPLPFGAEIENDGVWCQILNRSPNRSRRPALFLDRDGVIVEEVHYLSRVEDVRIIDGAAEIIASANAQNISVIIITNQSGIARGKFGWQHFIDVQEKILADLDNQNAYVNAVFACPFHSEGHTPYQHPDHPCRKPNPGMIEKAKRNFSIDKQKSWIIGDRAADLSAGKNGGLCRGIHVATGHGDDVEQNAAVLLKDTYFDVVLSTSIADAIKHITF